VVGTIADLGKQVDVDARLIEIEANLMIWGATVTIDKDPTLITLDRGPELSGSSVGPSLPKVKDGNLLAELRENQPGWVIHGNNYNLVNSQLSAQGLFTTSVGDSSWDKYAIEFDVKQLVNSGYHLSILVRRQSDTEYVGLQLRSWHNCGSRWVIARERRETVVVNSEVKHDCAGHYRIEVEGNKYKLFKDGSQMFVFTNNGFANGGVGLKSVNSGYGGIVTFIIDNFKVVSLRR
jgi:hypothetical protein